MPSETAESNATELPLTKSISKTFAAKLSTTKNRRSFDESSALSEPYVSAGALPSESWTPKQQPTNMNGGDNPYKGPEPSSSPLLNGLAANKPADLPSSTRVASSATITTSRSNSIFEENKKSGEWTKESVPRPGAAEEGYLTPTIPNGKFIGSTKPSIGKSSLDATNAENGPALSSVAENLSPLSTKDGSADGMLKPPVTKQTHRASSPPAFSPMQSPTLSAKSPTMSAQSRPDRLVHRHTLEVPKVRTSTVRDSSEFTAPAESSAVSASGKFSPNTPTRRRGSMQISRRATRSIHSDLHLDEVPQDEDAARWTEHIRSRRASKRSRTTTDDDRVLVGTKVDEHHANWVTAYNMLTGIRFCVSRITAKLDRELDPSDFTAKHKFGFDIIGTELTPSAKYDFKFKDYAPWVFRHLRARFRIDPADYLVSLTAKLILSELGSPGKSGSFFYFSRDYKYIIKTIHHGEHKFLRKILKQYYNHVTENPNTLLSQFYGLHRVKIPYGRKIHFVVMNNLFPPHRDIHHTFDLKGSTIGRDFKEEELEKNPRATLKDLNWLRRNLNLEFGPIKKEAFVTQMEKDVTLLQKLNVMDYSLLVGIHDLERGNEEKLRGKSLRVFQPGGDKADNPQMGNLARTPSRMESAKRAQELRNLVHKEKPVPIQKMLDNIPADSSRKGFYFYTDDGGFRATHEDNLLGDEVYYLGIIDCLTRWNTVKKAEHFWKGMRGNESQISPIPPVRYGDRFVKFISGITMSSERAAQQTRASRSLDAASAVALTSHSDGTTEDPILGKNSLSKRDPTDPPGTATVMERAELTAERSLEKGANEDIVPEREVGTAKSPGGPSESATLPVIGEAVENGSQLSKTPTPSHEVVDASTANNEYHHDHKNIEERHPPTPPKGEGSTAGRSSLEEKTATWLSGAAPPTPPKDERKLHKNESFLPIPPPGIATSHLTASPGPADLRFRH